MMQQGLVSRISALVVASVCVAAPVAADVVFPSEPIQSLALKVATASGSVDVVLAGGAQVNAWEALFDGLARSSAEQVRFSATTDAPSRREALALVESYIADNGLDWHVCHGWWMSPDSDYVGALIREKFGGSLIFFDEGPTSDVIDNPESDVAASVAVDALYSGGLDGRIDRVVEPSAYYDAINAIWSQIVPVRQLDEARQSRGGWIDGC